MRTYAAVAALVLMLGAMASAQMQAKPMEIPNNELSFGYAYMTTTTSGPKVDESIGFDRTGINGFSLNYSHYFNGKLGAALEVYHGSSSRADRTGIEYARTSYMVGPTYRAYQHGFWLGSVHAMGGIDHATFTVPYTSTTLYHRDWNYQIAGGATIDGNLTRHMAIRLAQVDYVYANHFNSSQSGFRYTAGLTVRF